MLKNILLLLLASLFLFYVAESNNIVVDKSQISKNKDNLKWKYNSIIEKINQETDTTNKTKKLIFKKRKYIGYAEVIPF